MQGPVRAAKEQVRWQADPESVARHCPSLTLGTLIRLFLAGFFRVSSWRGDCAAPIRRGYSRGRRLCVPPGDLRSHTSPLKPTPRLKGCAPSSQWNVLASAAWTCETKLDGFRLDGLRQTDRSCCIPQWKIPARFPERGVRGMFPPETVLDNPTIRIHDEG